MPDAGRRVFRLLLDERGDGPWNMAVDETLLATAQADGVATLRFYRWQGAWLSLGHAQELRLGQVEACRAAGVGIVRRITGGRAVLHGQDLTYALAAPSDALPPGLEASYAVVSRALLRGLSRLGVTAAPAPRTPDPGVRAAPFDCFAHASTDEICVDGRKLAGSAQRRVAGAFLQHGSLRMEPDPAAAARAAGSHEGVATSLRELGLTPDWEALCRVLCETFAAELSCSLALGTLTEAERTLATARAARPGEKPRSPSHRRQPLSSRPRPTGR